METFLSAIIGALFGSFSAAGLSYIYHERKEKQVLKINCRLLLDVVIKHATWLDKDRLIDEESILRFAKEIDLELWDDLKYKLPGITFDQFEVLRQHFKDMKEIKTTVANFNSLKSLYPIPDDLLLPNIEACKEASEVLFKICYVSEKSLISLIPFKYYKVNN